MRVRFWALIAAMLVLGALAVGLGGCASGGVARGPANTPAPTKTLRPTFTPTVPKPALTPSPASGQSNGQPTQEVPAGQTDKPTPEPPTATAEPPTAAPSPTPESAALTVSTASINVRSGPGTTYPVLGRLTQGQSFPVTGKSEDGDWWQFDYNGKPGWVVRTNVATTGAESVQVAENIPQPPTAAPRPTARPAAPKPAQPPAQPAAPSTKYAALNPGKFPNDNDFVNVYCILYGSAANTLQRGTIRVLRDGQVVESGKEFSDQPTYVQYLGNSGYNAGCKVELSPAVPGNYTAVIVEGDKVVSDPINFTVSGPENRIWFVAWKPK